MTDDEKQLDLFYKIDKSFTKILNSWVDSGVLSEIGPYGLMILVVLKRFTSWYASGFKAYAHPSHKKISELTGMSIGTIKRHIKKLIDLGYIEQIKGGHRHNHYALTEKFIAIALKEDLDDKVLNVPFIPMSMDKRIKEMREYETKGILPESSPIRIEKIEINNLQVNIINNETNSQSVNIVAPLDEIDQLSLPKWVRDKVKNRIESKIRDASDELSGELLNGVNKKTNE